MKSQDTRYRMFPSGNQIKNAVILSVLVLLCMVVMLIPIKGRCLGDAFLDWVLVQNIPIIKRRYILDYYKEIGEEKFEVGNQEVLNRWGEPDEVLILDYYELKNYKCYMLGLKYGDLVYCYHYYTMNSEDYIPSIYGKGEFMHFEIVGDSISLGKKHLTVGSTRRQVLLAYWECTKMGGIPAGDGFCDGEGGYTQVRFKYDKNDIVTEIHFG